MDIQFFNNSDRVPKPRNEIKIEELSATPYPDRFRIFIEIKVTPFQERPNLLVLARDVAGKIVSELNIIETMHADMEFTMHIRNVAEPAGDYELSAELFYETRNPPQDSKVVEFSVPVVDEG